MKNRFSIRIVLLLSSLFFWGCSHRFDRFGFFKLKAGKPAKTAQNSDEKDFLLRVIPLNFKFDVGVLQEDAANFSAFFTEQLVKDPNFYVELRPEAIEQFSSQANQAEIDKLRSLGEKFEVEALVRGRIKTYTYRMGPREFEISLHLEIEGVNTHNSEVFFRFDNAFVKKFRTRGRRQRDMSDYNLRFLHEVSLAIRESFDEQFGPLVIQQKSRHGGLIPSKQLSSSKSPGPHSKDELMHFYLWPVTDSGDQFLGPRPIIIKSSAEQLASSKVQQAQDFRSREQSEPPRKIQNTQPSVVKETQKQVVDPEELMLRSAQEAERRLAGSVAADSYMDSSDGLGSENSEDKRFQANIADAVDGVEALNYLTNRPAADESTLKLDLAGFQLVYPDRLLATKQYQKLYYLISQEDRPVSALDLENAGEDVLELEVFSTSDRTAVMKFLEDYFHGVFPNPKGPIPAVFERFYLGKLQLGFVLGNQAFVASTNRNNRKLLDKAIAEFYANNGGMTVAKILDHNLRNKSLDKVIFTSKNTSDYLPPQQTPRKSSKTSKKSSKRDASARLEAAQIREAAIRLVSKPDYAYPQASTSNAERIQQPINSFDYAPVNNEQGLEYEDGVIRNPWGNGQVISSESASDDFSVVDQNYENRPTQDSGILQKNQSIPSNALFFFDMGRRYFSSHDFDTSRRYFNLAWENGYRGNEITQYLSQIDQRIGGKQPNAQVARVTPAPPAYTEPVRQAYQEPVGQPARNYQQEEPVTSVAIESGAVDFTVQRASSDISPGSRNQRNRALADFYTEMEKMEAELKQYTQNKRQLATTAEGYSVGPEFAHLAFQILALIALVLFFLSFLSTRRIPASPLSRDFLSDSDKNS